jgi:hypothetical protein
MRRKDKSVGPAKLAAKLGSVRGWRALESGGASFSLQRRLQPADAATEITKRTQGATKSA